MFIEIISKPILLVYFKEGRPRKIKYIADYQNIANETYYELHKEDGWKIKFKSIGGVMQWCIWSKEYEEVEPEIYTNHEDLLYYAKKILISHSIVFVPVLVIYFIILISDISLFINGDGSLLSTLINLLLIIEFSLFYKNIVAYYFRIKKKIV